MTPIPTTAESELVARLRGPIARTALSRIKGEEG
jgi:hypothetical protein